MGGGLISLDQVLRVRILPVDIVLCSLAGQITLIVLPSTQVHKWVPANLTFEVTLRTTSIPSRGCRNTPSHSEHPIETNWGGISTDLMGCQTLPRLHSNFFVDGCFLKLLSCCFRRPGCKTF